MTHPTIHSSLFSIVAVLCLGCASSTAEAPAAATPSTELAAAPANPPHVAVHVPAAIQAIIDAPDRSSDDRALDAGRHPGELLAFFGVKAGMRVAEIGAGGGYTSELLARTVGADGKVFAVNSPWLLEKFAQAPWTQRLATPVMQNVTRLDRAFDDPFSADVQNLDAVFSVLIYHDLYWMEVDRAKMNAAVFRALKPGGIYAVVDHSGRVATGGSEVMTLHRIEQSAVRADVEKAGFKLVNEAAFLRNPEDARDWNDSPKAAKERRGASDRFVMLFVKP